MNSMMWLIIRKDLRRFWPVLALWCAALVWRAGPEALLGDERLMSGREEGMFALILVVLLNIHLVCRVIAEDSPIKEAAFWRMRPVTGGQVLRAKLVFLGGWTVVLPMAVAAVATWNYGFTVREAAEVVIGQGLVHGAIGLGFVTLAVLTQSVLVSIAGLWLATVFMQVASATIRPVGGGVTLQAWAYKSVSLEWSRTLVVTMIAVAACISAAAWVYARRDRWGAFGAVVLGVLGAWAAGAFWTWDVLGAVPALKRLEASEDGRHHASVVRTDTKSGSTFNDVSFRHLDATLRWTGTEEGDLCATYLVEGSLTTADGREIAGFNEVRSAAGYDLTVPLRGIGIGRVQGLPSMPAAEEGVTLMKLRTGELQALAGRELAWRGQVSAKVGRLEIEARVPLKVGAVFESGAYQFRISDVETMNAELKVTCVERRPDLPVFVKGANASRVVGGVSFMYALINTERGEAVVASGGGGGGSSSDGYFNYGRRTVHFGQRGDLAKRDKKEWAEWLRGAELVSFRFVEKRRVKTEVSAVYLP
jgi:hypothetical protein